MKFLLPLFLGSVVSFGQTTPENVDISGLGFRNIGPALTSGRISDFAVNPNNFDEYYVATASGGVWKTTNHGVTYSPIFDGQGSYSIGCVSIAPSNEHVVWVGTGENNNQRSVAYGDGVYKSTDGGRSWQKMGLENSEHIGMIAIHPEDENTVYVAAYGPLWSAGGDRGLYKTTDGGKTWNRILEISENTGINEVHLDPRNPNVIYATAHQRRRHVWTYISGGPESAIYKSIDGGESFEKLGGGLPSGDVGRIGMDISPVNPDVLFACIEGHGFYRSTDRGASWSKRSGHETSGNYYVELFASPHDVDVVYSMDTYAQWTQDGGKTFTQVGEDGKHVDNHALWINPNNPDHFLMGCDGGIYETWDNAAHWHFKDNLPVTQFYRVSIDYDEPFYNVYGGTQDNFSLGGPSRTINDKGIVNSDWFITNTGDGFETQVDPIESNIVYAQAQYGHLVRYDRNSGEAIFIQPSVTPDEPALRWNWDAPLIISPHDNQTLYFAANRVFKSTDRGNSWTAISGDLTQQIDRNALPVMGRVWSVDAIAKNKSTTIYGNIVALSESPKVSGLVYAGTDDGLIQVTDNDGANWTRYNTFPGVPANTYVYDVEASIHDENVVYATFNNHKNGDFKPYVMKSTNRGKSWTSIGNGLPERGSAYDLAQDHENPNLLFLGTEFGLYFTVDGGQNWRQIKRGLPTIAIRDIDIQRRENDLVLASFGRGFFILDDYSPLRHLSTENLDNEAYIFPIKEGLIFAQNNSLGYGAPGFMGHSYYMAENPPIGATFTYFIKETPSSPADQRREAEKEMETITYPSSEDLRAEDRYQGHYLTFVIRDAEGNEIRRINTGDGSGIKRLTWDGQLQSNAALRTGGAPTTNGGTMSFAPEGTYTVQIYRTNNGSTAPLTEPASFHIHHMKNNYFYDENREAISSFLKDLDNLRRDLSAVNQELRRQNQVVSHLEAAIRNTPGAPMRLLEQLQAIRTKLADMSIDLNGDQSLASREFEVPRSLNDMLNYAYWYSSSYTGAPTQSFIDDAAYVESQMDGMISQLRQTGDQLLIIKEQAYAAGAPYLEGDLPNDEE